MIIVASNVGRRQSQVIAYGGAVFDADGYRVHTFSAGTDAFNVYSATAAVEYLVVAGGGGGGGAGIGHRSTAGWTNGTDWVIRVQSGDGKIGFGYDISGAYWDMGPYVAGQWAHYAVTRSGTTLQTFKDGAVVTTATSSSAFDSSYPLLVGRNISGYDYKGYVSNVRIVKGTAVYRAGFTPPAAALTAVSGTSLLTCQSSSTVTDASGNGIAVTLGSGNSANALTPFGSGGSAYVGGSTAISVADNAALRFGTGDFTVEFWVNLTNPTTAGQTLFEKGYIAAGGMVCQTVAGGAFVFYLGGAATLSNVGQLSAGWNHLAFTRSGGSVKAFVNGTLVGVGTSSVDLNDPSALGIGASTNPYGNGAYPSVGYFSNFRAVKGAALYTGAGFTPPAAPLTAVTNTSLLTAQDKGRIADASSNAFAVTGAGDVRPAGETPFAQKGDGRWSSVFTGAAKLSVTSPSSYPSLTLGGADYTYATKNLDQLTQEVTA